jgi:uncharacterized membrane protein YfcA
VLLAALIFKNLPVTAVRWLVVLVVIYTAFTMLRSALQGSAAVPAATAKAKLY